MASNLCSCCLEVLSCWFLLSNKTVCDDVLVFWHKYTIYSAPSLAFLSFGVIDVQSMRQCLIWGETVIAHRTHVHERVTWNKAWNRARLGGCMKLHPLLHQLNSNQSHLVVPRYGDCSLSKAITLNQIMDRSFPIRPKAWFSKSDQLVQTHGCGYEWCMCLWVMWRTVCVCRSKKVSFYRHLLSLKGQESQNAVAQCNAHHCSHP